MKTVLIRTAFLTLIALVLAAGAAYSSEEIIEFPLTGTGDIVSSEFVELDPRNEGALLVDSEGRSEVILFVLDGAELGEKRLTYSAKMSSEGLVATEDTRGIAYLELTALFPDGEELIARGPRVPLTGTTEWRPANTVLYVDKGTSPESVTLSLIVEGRGKVWIEDVKLLHRPLRTDYLFWGHVVVWILLIIYIYHLMRKQKRLEQELRTIESRV